VSRIDAKQRHDLTLARCERLPDLESAGITEGTIRLSVGLENPDPLADGVDLVRGEARNMPITHAISNGFGFGGVNASIVLRRWS